MNTDIDIDVANRDAILEDLLHIPAAIITQNSIKKHNVGVYFQETPIDPVTGFSSIDYKSAESRGYCKFDLLNVHIYEKIRNEEHLNRLINTEPVWDLLQSEDFVDGYQLFHLHGHCKILKTMKPSNIEELAMVLALIRPNKNYLIGKSWKEIQKEIWIPTEGYYFKKAHSFGYAMAVVVHMNLIVEDLMSD